MRAYKLRMKFHPYTKSILLTFVAFAAVTGLTLAFSPHGFHSEPSTAPKSEPVFTKEESLKAELENMKYQLQLTQSQLMKIEENEQKVTEEIKLYKRELAQYKSRFGTIKAEKDQKLANAGKTITSQKKKKRKVISVTFSEDGSYTD
ncbi:MAG: hypothetical protein AB7F59_08950 [Bdellovibrionales bacterium]